MTYCPNIWVSHHFYEEVLAALRDRSVNSQRTQASVPVYRSTGESTTEYLLISAFVNFTQNTADFKPSYRIHSDSIVGLPAVGDHSLVLLDHNGSKLITYSVQISSGSDNDPDEDEYGLLVETVPWIDGTAQIALQHNGQTLATQNVSAATPQVTVDQPNGHEFITDVLEVGWSANDADGDALSYTVQYSHDGGQSWDTVGTGITNTLSVHLDAMHLPGSDNALVRVMASDGVNTSIDQSDQPFSVAHKVPEPIINSPADGETYVEGQTIGLFGDAYDVEDGYLRDAAITWTSDRSGILGTGTSVYPENMALGPHQITMMATDSDGNQSTATITLTIQQAPKPPSRASQPSPTIGATDVPIGASLSWTGGDPNPDDTVSYDVYFDTVDPPVLQVSSLLSATSYDPPGDLLPGMTYYWQVIAHDSSGLQTAGPVWSFTTTATAAFTLQSGWNMVSSHVQPGNPAVSSVLAGIVDEVVLMKNGDGQVYWPAFGINEIGDWDVTDGYQIYMSNPTALAITGTAVDPSATPIPLIAGWNMAAYLLGSPLAIDQALASIDGALYLAKNGDGQVYWPAFGVNQIGEMQPGQGYQLYMSNAGTLVYPGN
jgi:hypothetical protein